MNNDILISFVVPFYNVENYIVNCIESLYKQDIPLENYEVILINDCSLDSSENKVLELIRKYPTIKLIEHQNNKRQGAARNSGVDVAIGKYVWFIDSDDYIKPNTAGYLLDIALENDLDILHFDYTRVYDNGESETYPSNYTTGIVDGNSFFFDENEVWWKKSVEVWRRLHKKSFLTQNKLKFDEGVFYEDVTYSIKVFNAAKRIMHIPLAPYCYRLNPNSFTNAVQSSSKLIESIKLVISCLNLSENKILDKKYVPVLCDFSKYQINCVFDSIPYLSEGEKVEFFSKVNSMSLIKLIVSLQWYEKFVFKIGGIEFLYLMSRLKRYLMSIKYVFKMQLVRVTKFS